jgi:hypothetical protein
VEVREELVRLFRLTDAPQELVRVTDRADLETKERPIAKCRQRVDVVISAFAAGRHRGDVYRCQRGLHGRSRNKKDRVFAPLFDRKFVPQAGSVPIDLVRMANGMLFNFWSSQNVPMQGFGLRS